MLKENTIIFIFKCCLCIEADAADVEVAVKAARNAFDNGPWPRMSGRERGRVLSRFESFLKFSYIYKNLTFKPQICRFIRKAQRGISRT